MTDYAFAPGGNTPFDRATRRYLRERPNTTLVHGRRIQSIQDFINHLENANNIPTPIGNLIVVSHSAREGYLEIRLDNVRRNFAGADYEVLEEAEQHGNVRISDFLFNVGGGQPPVRRIFRIMGCNIGQAQPFIDKLSEVLGDRVRVRAPRYLNTIFTGPNGNYEHLSESFLVRSVRRLRNRPQILQAFQAETFHFYDGTRVPPATFDRWIPRRLRRSFLRRGGEIFDRASADARPSLDRVIEGQRRLRSQIALYHDVARFNFDIGVADRPPRARQDRMDLLEDSIIQDPTFQANHPFPQFRRYGFADTEAFVNGWRWRFNDTRIGGQRFLRCVGTRHDYEIGVPLVDRDTGHVLYHYVPSSGSATSVINALPEDDVRLFYTSA